MARLERIGDQERLVTSDGVSLPRPWLIDDTRATDLGIEPLPSQLPDALSMTGSQSPATAGGRRNVTQADIAAAATERDRQARADAEKEARLAALPQPPAAGRRNVTAADIQQAETARNARKEVEQGPAPKAEETKLRGGGTREEIGEAGAGRGGGHPQRTGGGIRKIPGGLRLEGYTNQVGVDPATYKGVEESMGKAVGSERSALQAEADATTQANAFEAQTLDNFIGEQGRKVEEGRAKLAKSVAATDDLEAELENERGKILQAEQDPHHFWADKSTGVKVLAGIGMLLSGIGGGNQNAGKMFEDAVKEDMARHREKLAAREKGANFMQSNLTRLREKLDPDLAEREMEARELAAVGAQIRAHGLRTGNQALIARANAEADKFEADARTKWAGISKEIGDRITTTVRNVPDQYIGTGPAAMKPEARERLVTFGNGQHRGFVVAGTARDKVQTAVTGYENIAATMDEMRALAKQASLGNLDAQRRYTSLRSVALQEANVLRGSGAMSKGDEENNVRGMPDITELTTTRAEAEAKLSEQSKWANQRLHSVVRDNVYADPDATTPMLRGAPQAQRGEQ